jgi:predicted nucleic acid-binding protein
MSRIFWDTNVFIYLLEDQGPLSERVGNLRRSMLDRGDQLFTSTLSLGELMVRPLRMGRDDIARKYEQQISLGAMLIPFHREAAFAFAEIRRDPTIKAPDAIQLACASHTRIDLFITNDNRLTGKKIAGIQFIVPLEKAFL